MAIDELEDDILELMEKVEGRKLIMFSKFKKPTANRI